MLGVCGSVCGIGVYCMYIHCTPQNNANKIYNKVYFLVLPLRSFKNGPSGQNRKPGKTGPGLGRQVYQLKHLAIIIYLTHPCTTFVRLLTLQRFDS